jgi:hypothetical protein
MKFAVVVIIILHALSGAELSVNIDKIVSMREGEHKGEVFTKEVQCIVSTNDGKFLSVVETCDEIRNMVGGKR